MRSLRAFIDDHVVAAWLLVAMTLAMKLVVPVGFMPHLSDGGIQLVVCNGMEQPAAPMATMHGMSGHHHDHGGPSKPDAPCPFAGLSAPTLGGTDPIQLAIALAAMLVAGLSAVVAIRVRAITHLRPPLRGPPIRA